MPCAVPFGARAKARWNLPSSPRGRLAHVGAAGGDLPLVALFVCRPTARTIVSCLRVGGPEGRDLDWTINGLKNEDLK